MNAWPDDRHLWIPRDDGPTYCCRCKCDRGDAPPECAGSRADTDAAALALPDTPTPLADRAARASKNVAAKRAARKVAAEPRTAHRGAFTTAHDTEPGDLFGQVPAKPKRKARK